MANRKTPGRDAFMADRATFINNVPPRYVARVKEILKDPNIDPVHVHNVKKGLTVDWNVLEALKKVAKESSLQTA